MNILPRRSEPQLPETVMGVKQTILARHGTATYVPKGHTIKIINTYGRQVVDTWAFALHAPPTAEEMEDDARDEEQFMKREDTKDGDETKENTGEGELQEGIETKGDEAQTLPSSEAEEKVKSETLNQEKSQIQNEEEKGEQPESSDKVEEQKTELGKGEDKTEPAEPEEPTKEKESEMPPKMGTQENEDANAEKAAGETQERSPTTAKGWSAYIPSVRGIGKKNPVETPDPGQSVADKEMSGSKSWGSYLPSIRGKKPTAKDGDPKEQRTWASYIPSGKAFNSYIPKNAISSIAAMHQRDPTKSVAEQLYDFSKTPVGAAGLSVATGSGYASSVYAAYAAFSRTSGQRADGNAPGMEFLSMTHTRSSTQHISPRVGDTLVTNLRAPLLTLVDDTSLGAHDTLMAACDPLRYRELHVEKWEEHGSCAENLVLALKELNMQVGLKGRKAIGGDVTVNNVPAPLNLFMNIPWTDEGELSWDPPKGKRGDYVKFRAERDCILVMSACPQDVTDINGKKPMVAHFVVDNPTEDDQNIADEREKQAQQIIEKARRRTEAEQKEGTRLSQSQLQTLRAPPPQKATIQQQSRNPAPARATSRTPSQTSSIAQSQAGLRNQAKPLPRRQSSQSSGRAPRKLNKSGSTRKPNVQGSPPLKETQRVESPPRRQPIPKPGKKAPKKLERRNDSSNSIPRA